jgi:hypothetical protein
VRDRDNSLIEQRQRFYNFLLRMDTTANTQRCSLVTTPVTNSHFPASDGISDSQCIAAAEAAELVTSTSACSDGITDSQCMVAAQAAELHDEAETFNMAESLIPSNLFDELTYYPSLSQSAGPAQPETTYFTLPADMRSLDWLADSSCPPEETLGSTLLGQPEQTPLPDTFTTPDTTINTPCEAPAAPQRPCKRLLNKKTTSIDEWSTAQLRAEYERRYRPFDQKYLEASKEELAAAIRQHESDAVAETIDDVLAQFENGLSPEKCKNCGKNISWYHHCNANKPKKQKSKLPKWLQ